MCSAECPFLAVRPEGADHQWRKIPTALTQAHWMKRSEGMDAPAEVVVSEIGSSSPPHEMALRE
jgi:hypothetical protein